MQQLNISQSLALWMNEKISFATIKLNFAVI